jgi:N-acetylglucosaminyldiphosphoundecaprenol N-acetyl-beta-D-mannosaminyltransferase
MTTTNIIETTLERRQLEKYDVLGVGITASDYHSCVDAIIRAAQNRTPFAVTALAVHGLVTAFSDRTQQFRLAQFGLVTPDGQPVRWALRLLHGLKLPDRVYGPTLMLRTCEAAARTGTPIYLYGSTAAVLSHLARSLRRQFPELLIAGYEPSKFRRTSPEEKAALVEHISSTGARIVFVGLGCPRQEVFAFEYHRELQMPVLAVGAAFDYHAGLLKEPPAWMQRSGLQWFFRLAQEPRRLFWRYFWCNSVFVVVLVLQALRLWRPDPQRAVAPSTDVLYG